MPAGRMVRDEDGFIRTTIRKHYMPGSYVDDLQPASPPSSETIVSKISAMIVRIEDRPLRSAIDNHHDPSYR
jgi:hypothetical protein